MSEQQQVAMSEASGYINNQSSKLLEGVRGYRPRQAKYWEELRPMTVEAVLSVRPAGWLLARDMMKVAYEFAIWATEVAMSEPVAAKVFTARNVQRYTQRRDRVGTYARQAREAGWLGRMAEAITGERPRTGLLKQSEPEPYTRTELAEVISAAHTMRTPLQVHTALGVIALGAGAGLTSAELGRVTVRDVASDSVVATREDGQRRTVPIIPRWRQLLPPVQSGDADDFYLAPRYTRTAPRRSPIHEALKFMPGLVPNPSRLRATWMTELLRARVDALTLMHLAGLETMQVFSRFDQHVTPMTDTERAELISNRFTEVAA